MSPLSLQIPRAPARRACGLLALAVAAFLGGCAQQRERADAMGAPPAAGESSPPAAMPGTVNTLDSNLERPDYPYKSGPPNGALPSQ